MYVIIWCILHTVDRSTGAVTLQCSCRGFPKKKLIKHQIQLLSELRVTICLKEPDSRRKVEQSKRKSKPRFDKAIGNDWFLPWIDGMNNPLRQFTALTKSAAKAVTRRVQIRSANDSTRSKMQLLVMSKCSISNSSVSRSPSFETVTSIGQKFLSVGYVTLVFSSKYLSIYLSQISLWTKPSLLGWIVSRNSPFKI